MYIMDHRVRYSETDYKRNVKLWEILNYMQDCSLFHSEHINRGLDELEQKRRAWLLIAWQIEILDYPKFMDQIQIETWPYDFKKFFGSRNFAIRNEAGEYIVKANSMWVFTDIDKGMPVKPLEEDIVDYVMSPKLPMNYMPRKIDLPEQMDEKESVVVEKHMLDTNNHMNNSRYVEVAMNYLPSGYEVKHLRVDYRKEAKLHDHLIPRVSKVDDLYIVAFYAEDDSIHAIVEFGEQVVA